MAVAQCYGQHPLERSSFRGPRQERCWHRSGVGKPERSWHLVTARMVLEFVITKHLIFVCADTSNQKWSQSGERKPKHSSQAVAHNKIVSLCKIFAGGLFYMFWQLAMCTKDCSSGTNDTMHAEKKRSRSTNWGVHFLGARIWSFFFLHFFAWNCIETIHRFQCSLILRMTYFCGSISVWILNSGKMARVHAAFVIKQVCNESLRTGLASRVVVTFGVWKYWWSQIQWVCDFLAREVFLGFFSLRFHSLRQRIVLCDEDSTGVDPDPGRCPGKQGASMVTDRIQSIRVFLPRRPFLSPPSLQGEVLYGKSVMIKRRNRGVSEINGAIVRHIKSDDHVDSGKVVTRFMFSHTIISSSNTNFWKIGSHDTFERQIQSHCGKVNLSRSRWNRYCINERSVVTTWELPTIATQLYEADFHPAVSVTNELGRLFLFFLHQPFQIASWNIEKQHDPRLPSVRQSEPCQHSSRHVRNTKYVSEMKIVQNPNLLGTMCWVDDRR